MTSRNDSCSHRNLSRQRGVTVFVVMMAVLILTSAGTWALYSTGLTNQASGYSRAAAQAMFTGELGVIGGSAYLGLPGMADANYRQATKDLAAGDPDDCWTAPSDKFCKSIMMSDINETISDQSGSFGTAYNLTEPGSFGPYTTGTGAIQGDFILEVTEPRQALVEGMETNSNEYQRVTLTSLGIVRPLNAGTLCTGDAANNAAATQIGMRAHMIVGPLSSAVNF